MERIQDFEKPPRVTLKRSLIIFLGNVLGLYLISFLELGVSVGHFGDIALFVIFVSIINAVLWPILTRILMPFLVLTFGVGTLILNGLLLNFIFKMQEYHNFCKLWMNCTMGCTVFFN
ncbi:phage holin family protein [bacterium]|nr:phage holin family protein [bacterium]